MVEGGVSAQADKTEFTECWKTTWRTPYIMRLALSAGIGGLLFGYDTGVISGALLYIRDEFDDFDDAEKSTVLQEWIVSSAVLTAIFGAGFGGVMNDSIGRKKTMMIADVLFFIGALIMGFAPTPMIIILGRLFIGLGVGMASMTSPLYISEASPHRIRGALVSTNGLLITGGQFLSYLINLGFTQVRGTWRWMLGVAGLPAFIQFFLMLTLPESPRYLYRKNKIAEARAILERIYPADEIENEMKGLQASIEHEKALDNAAGGSLGKKLKGAFSDKVTRRALYAGITTQVAQQFSGINSVMYYGASIVQFAGFASNSTAMALSLITSGLNAVGSLVSMTFVDRYGRRRMMLVSLFGIISCLLVLTVVFYISGERSPPLDAKDSANFPMKNSTCMAYADAPDASSWNCMKCLRAQCGFCANSDSKYQPGACLAREKHVRFQCFQEERSWFADGCPSKIGFVAVIFMALYIISYSPGLGTAPWIVNSEIYPLRYRGIGGGTAAVCNWTSNLIVSGTFLSLTKAVGSAGTFLLFAGYSTVGLIAIYLLVPETKGLQFEEIEEMLDKGYKPWKSNK